MDGCMIHHGTTWHCKVPCRDSMAHHKLYYFKALILLLYYYYYYLLMSISCHFPDCQVLLVMILTHIRDIANAQPFTIICPNFIKKPFYSDFLRNTDTHDRRQYAANLKLCCQFCWNCTVYVKLSTITLFRWERICSNLYFVCHFTV